MGSFGGHILPGSFFILFGLWWTYSIFSRYFRVIAYRSNNKNNVYYECTATFQSKCCPNIPIEAILKVLASTIGIIVEAVTAMDDGKFILSLNAGIIDILLFYGFPLPVGSDYMSMSFACAVEAILFIFHLHGRTPLDVQVHTLLIISIVASTVAVLIEWKYKYSFLSSFFRVSCILLQGTWFYQVGFILYPPFAGSQKPDAYSHKTLMLITASFCWHFAAIIFFMLFVGYCFYIKYRPLLVNQDVSGMRHSPHSYPNVKYRNFENDNTPHTPQSNSNHFKENSHSLSNNSKLNKYSLDESTEEML